MLNIWIWIFTLSPLGSVAQDNYSIRLDGGTTTSGRVEVYFSGEWGTVCDDNWDILDATVTCRQLGFRMASLAFGNAVFGEGTGSIHFDDVQCNGDELSLSDCHFTSQHDCEHSEDAGVACVPYARLAGGTTTSGRVEVFLNGEWGTVCDDDWDILDATVACRQLGFRTASLAFGNAVFGEGTGSIHFDDVQCNGDELLLSDCHFTSQNDCGHSEDAGVVCVPYVDYPVRLAGGDSLSGRVEVLVYGEWGTVCDDDWDILDATVVCRQLGFRTASEAFSNAVFGEGTGSIHFDDVQCNGDELSLSDCHFTSQHDCEHSEDACIVCVPYARLAGGTTTSGRVEIFLNGEWGTVCDDDWDILDATVACRQLGFRTASHAFGYAVFGEGTGSIHFDDVKCNGDELSLNDCQFTSQHDCEHSEDAGVVCVPYAVHTTTLNILHENSSSPVTQKIESCSSDGLLRLSGGDRTSGRVEICLNEQWGTVCDDQWDMADAKVVCYQLGFKTASHALPEAYFGEGHGPIHLDESQCLGRESNLLSCNHSRSPNCQHKEDASVRCVPFVKGELRLVGGNASAGRVEVYFDGYWGTVCDDEWDKKDADVVCRNMGFPGAISALKNAAFGEGDETIHIDHVQCTGDERSLLACEYKRDPDCRHHEDASVVCRTSEDDNSEEDPVWSSMSPTNEQNTETSWKIPLLSVGLFVILVCLIGSTIFQCVLRKKRARQEELKSEKEVNILRPLPDTPTTTGSYDDTGDCKKSKTAENEVDHIPRACQRSQRARPSENHIYSSIIEDNDERKNELEVKYARNFEAL